MTSRTRHTAEYFYPGSFFPESVTRDIPEPTLEAVLAAAPRETEGYFRVDGWYAVTVRAIAERRYTADDAPDEQVWMREGVATVASWVVGHRVYVNDLPQDDRHRILRANVAGNSRDGYAVRTRAGTWQIAENYDLVIAPEAAVTRPL